MVTGSPSPPLQAAVAKLALSPVCNDAAFPYLKC